MNIDYAAIIETANRRKEALKKIEELVAEAPDMAHLALNLVHYTTALKDAWNAVDLEGKKLLPAAVRDILGYGSMETGASNLYGVKIPDGPERYALSQLARLVSAAP